ncbi:DUF1919 domain-containing protein [Aestuariibaculum suncheonense]|uniref:DUF1919 domain-containing protein n=1 Tax=Aestuariibaculum suncheonense TaxID=1028745 RepID=A0A8J6Q4K5_9FLAO|nr:DUF1919 domain-containing protein [Aestuariibaculum suncheonense]MBD0834923.1 DUF1919 domain-containing protein [Aestuariibaculum suncheonense]
MVSLKFATIRFSWVRLKAIFLHLEFFIRRKINKHFKNKDVALLKNTDFVIIANNCFAGQVYKSFGLPYNTPFVGMFLYGPCYLKLLQDFKRYMNEELVFVEESVYKDREKTYPVAKLGDIELHFSHYNSEKEASEKWHRRRNRMLENFDLDNFYFIISDRERVDDEVIKDFHKLPFKNKLSFGAKTIDSLGAFEHVALFQAFKRKQTQALGGTKLFKISPLYFDFENWINEKEIRRTRFNY